MKKQSVSKPNRRRKVDVAFMREIGAKGGKNGNNRPFRDREKAREAGRLGGLKSRRKKAESER